jgi:outer membrane protein
VNGKKYLLVLLAGLLVTLALGSAALAQDTVGIIDPQKVLFQHPKFKQTQDQINAMMQKKEQEAKAAIEKEKDEKKKAQIYQQKRSEASQNEQKLMEPLFKDINVAIEKVAKGKKLSVVINKAAVFYGGVDITDDVIQALKK